MGYFLLYIVLVFIISCGISYVIGIESAGWVFVIVFFLLPIIFLYPTIKEDQKRAQEKKAQEQKAKEQEFKKEQAVLAQREQKLQHNATLKIRSEYSNFINSIPIQTKLSSFPSDHLFRIQEIYSQVSQNIKILQNQYDQIQTYIRLIQNILSCPGCTNTASEYQFLMDHSEELEKLKEQIHNIYQQIEAKRIPLPEEQYSDADFLRQAFYRLAQSEKCFSEHLDISKFISDQTPNYLSMFSYSVQPVTLFLNNYFFCVFPSCILIFDQSGVFADVLSSAAFEIIVEKRTAYVKFIDDEITPHPFLDSDSKVIQRGTKKLAWQHMCKDGSRDMRFAYNPQIMIRRDLCEYANITFQIGFESVCYTVSSGKAILLMEQLRDKFAEARHTPSFAASRTNSNDITSQ